MTKTMKIRPSVSSNDSGQSSSKEGSFRRLFTYPLVRRCDMDDITRKGTLKIIAKACESNLENNEMAAKSIKETLDQKYGGSWHAVVGMILYDIRSDVS
ncbi:unnamed protein product [Dracunculus medinensis]|uniref:Dynein light chain n=1 Tax=Dracunculus medinensis TaxID=318479 RepID=A0A0N4U450_DRAME|nr:unnamed protein product [Dracunculus medinensis]